MSEERVGGRSRVVAAHPHAAMTRPAYERRMVAPSRPRVISDMRVAKHPAPSPQPKSRPATATLAPNTHPSNVRPSRSQVLRRDAFMTAPLPDLPQQPPRPQAVRKKRSHKKLAVGLVMVTVAVLLFGAGVGIGMMDVNTDQTVAAQQKTPGVSQSDSEASGQTKSSLDSYRVAADLPRIISIPKLHVQARVVPVGVASETEIGAPDNIFDTGWYDTSARPGTSGAMLINGYSQVRHSVFAELRNLRPDDLITVERGDGQILTYKVVGSKSYPTGDVDMAAALSPIQSDTAGLNLMTLDDATGNDNGESNRLVVFAALTE